MKENEYLKFAKKFNKWADNENHKIIEAADRLGLTKPVLKELVLKLPTNVHASEEWYEQSYVLGKEQMLTIKLVRSERTEGVKEFIRTLGDPELIELINNMDDYEIQALLTKDVLPSYVPYIDQYKYNKDELVEVIEDDGYQIEEIKNQLKR